MFSQMAQQPQPQQGIPPQILQALMQQQAQGGQRPPMLMPPQGAPQPQMQSGMSPNPQGSSAPSQQNAGSGIPPQILQMLMAQMQKQAPQQLAAQGRNGDSMIAHLTPGEIMVPPQVQTHKVLATLDKAYKQKGVQPQQFTAGSPASSVNPKTGVPEYNFLSAFLPAALGVAATAATGGLAAPSLLSAAAGGLGAAGGGLLTGQTPTQAALTGLGSAGGAYIGGNIASGLGATGSVPAGAPMGATADSLRAASTTPNALQSIPGIGSIMPNTPSLGSGIGSLVGGYLGGQLGSPPKSNSPNYPAGFNANMPAIGSLGSAQQQLGQTNSIQPQPTFAGYNPATNYPAAYNFRFGG